MVEQPANLTNTSDQDRDQDLLRRMLAGDEEAFAALFRRQRVGVYRFALHMCGLPAVAEDVTREVFLILIKRGSCYEPSATILPSKLFPNDGIPRNSKPLCSACTKTLAWARPPNG